MRTRPALGWDRFLQNPVGSGHPVHYIDPCCLEATLPIIDLPYNEQITIKMMVKYST